MTIVAVVVQAILSVLMIIGGRGLSALLPAYHMLRPGQVDLGTLIKTTTRRFLLALLVNLAGGFIFMTARDLILRNGVRDSYTFVLTLGLVLNSCNSAVIGFIMHSFFWTTMQKAREEMEMEDDVNRAAELNYVGPADKNDSKLSDSLPYVCRYCWYAVLKSRKRNKGSTAAPNGDGDSDNPALTKPNSTTKNEFGSKSGVEATDNSFLRGGGCDGGIRL